MIYHSIHSDDHLLYLVLRGKRNKMKEKKLKHSITVFLLIVNGRNNISAKVKLTFKVTATKKSKSKLVPFALHDNRTNKKE